MRLMSIVPGTPGCELDQRLRDVLVLDLAQLRRCPARARCL